MAQLPGYFACFPGAGRYQVRRKGCTSRNTADFLPVFEPWGGSEAADSLFATPLGTPLRFGLFDASMGNAFHGLICADTGAGKSLTAGALLADAFLAGKDAILVDNGWSRARLTRVLGGAHLEVTLNTAVQCFSTKHMRRPPPLEALVDQVGVADLPERVLDPRQGALAFHGRCDARGGPTMSARGELARGHRGPGRFEARTRRASRPVTEGRLS